MSIFNYSVIIPFGKHDGDFERCLTSVLHQEILPEKIIVVCNGKVTTDYAVSIFKKNTDSLQFAERIIFIYSSEIGNANIARNVGIDNCETEWIAFLDSDDWWDCRWVKAVNLKITQDNPDFIYGSICVYSENEKKLYFIATNCYDYVTPENYLLAYQSAQTSTFFVKIDLAKKNRWDNRLHRHQDYDFFVRIVADSKSITVISEPLVNVDWTKPTNHKYHMDCFRVISKWNGRVNSYNYARHIYYLVKSCFKAMNWMPIPYFLFLLLRIRRNNLPRSTCKI